MGTRADFYIGTGRDAEWLGSVGWDGNEWADDKESPLMTAKTGRAFRRAVSEIAAERHDFISPEQGFPWPWETSNMTDYVYFFDEGEAKYVYFDDRMAWPNMRAIQSVACGNRSGR